MTEIPVTRIDSTIEELVERLLTEAPGQTLSQLVEAIFEATGINRRSVAARLNVMRRIKLIKSRSTVGFHRLWLYDWTDSVDRNIVPATSTPKVEGKVLSVMAWTALHYSQSPVPMKSETRYGTFRRSFEREAA